MAATPKLYDLVGYSAVGARFYTLVSAPSSPLLLTPPNGAAHGDSPVLFRSTYRSTDGYSANAYALELRTTTATSYSYWNASTAALQSTIAWNSCSVATETDFSVTLPMALFALDKTYNWSMAYRESEANLEGEFASPFAFKVAALPSVSVTAPTGTLGTTAAVVSYAATPTGSASLTYYRVMIYSTAQHAASGFTPGTTPGIWDSGKVAGNPGSVVVPVTLTSATTYYAYVQVWQTGTTASAWAYSTFTVRFDAPAIPSLTAEATSTPVSKAPAVLVTVESHTNLLTAADASFEIGTGTWTATPVGAFTLSRSAAWAADGSYSLEVAPLYQSIEAPVLAPTSYPCEPERLYTFIAHVRTARVECSWKLEATWETSAGTAISTETIASGYDSTAGVQLKGTLTSPPTAVNVVVKLTTTEAWSILPPPGAPTIRSEGAPGSTHYEYEITAVDDLGETVASSPGLITTGYATLSATNFNLVTWSPVTGATEYRVYREVGATFDFIGAPTSTTFKDTGQAASTVHPPTVNTTAETHNIDAVGIFPGSVTSWSAGGFLNNSSARVQFTTAGTWKQLHGTSLPYPSSGVIAFYDYTAPHGVTRTYRAQTVASVGGANVTSLTHEAEATTLPNNWWFYDVLDPTLACSAYRAQSIAIIYGATAKTSFSETRKSTSTFIQAFTRPTYIEVLGTVMDTEFNLVLDFLTGPSLERFLNLWEANVQTGHVILAKSDMTHKIYWINFGPTLPTATLRGSTRTTMPIRQISIHCYPATPVF